MAQWWKTAVFYEIYNPSFCDSNYDGIGDFNGITSKLEYLQELGIDAIWLTPFYKSPKVDNGYDISDYYSIDPEYGTMEDFERFLTEAHRREIKVVADLVLNHTSDRHPWFVESRSSKDNPKRDWYIWKDPLNNGMPNNWESFFSGSAWEFDENTKQYYYHAFSKEQVDLNWNNEEVKKEMFNVVEFWLKKGIDGFRLDVIDFLTVDDEFCDNPYDAEGKQIHLYDKNKPKVHKIIRELRRLVKGYGEKVLIGEVGTEDFQIAKDYLHEEELDLVFNFNLGSIGKFNLDRIYNEIKEMDKQLDEDRLPTLFFSSHDMSRYISRFGEQGFEVERAKAVCALVLLARGVPFVYYGDEIGMRDLCVSDIKQMKDVQGLLEYKKELDLGKVPYEALHAANKRCRDKSRSPMQWNGSKNAGFSIVEPWLDVSCEYPQINVEVQSKYESSLLGFYKILIELRKKYEALHKGIYEVLRKEDEAICFVKKCGNQRFLVIINFGAINKVMEISDPACNEIKLIYSSENSYIRMRDKIAVSPYGIVILQLLNN